MIDPEALRSFGKDVEFGRTAVDYATHRAGFPPVFFQILEQQGYALPGQTGLDLGTGTGAVARGLAGMGLRMEGLDPSPDLLAQAEALDREAGVEVRYHTGVAEDTKLAANAYDLITAGQCWHWFDRPVVATEATRLLRLGGRLIIAHFDWLPLPGNVVEATEALILQHNPGWAGAGGTGIYPAWLGDLAQAGFGTLETLSVDVAQPYSPEAWRGRIRASAGIAATLNAEDTDRFDAELGELLRRDFPQEVLSIPHRVWLATGVLSGESDA